MYIQIPINPNLMLKKKLNRHKNSSPIEQFLVTNCNKERPGSIVTKTLKDGVLIAIVTSKELYFNADFKYISFIKIKFTHQKLRENLPHFKK